VNHLSLLEFLNIEPFLLFCFLFCINLRFRRIHHSLLVTVTALARNYFLFLSFFVMRFFYSLVLVLDVKHSLVKIALLKLRAVRFLLVTSFSLAKLRN